MNYYNEHDKYAAQWLRNLMTFDYIAYGDVDERSIEDVHPADLKGYTQCHFFAGIGVWQYALRRAGWRDDRPVWSGSCPCQPFSAAGKGGGTADERHLWPAWEWLIARAKPRGVPVFGEQVASKPGLAWLDLVHADLEGQGHTVRTADLCAAGVGAPHIRQRLFFVADDEAGRRGEVDSLAGGRDEGNGAQGSERSERGDGVNRRRLADDAEPGRSVQPQRPAAEMRRPAAQSGRLCDARGIVGDADDAGSQGRGVPRATAGGHGAGECAARAPGPVNGHWFPAEWLPCIDGKARPVEPGTSPLAHGAPARVGRLRAYGNAIVAPLAEEFIRGYMT